jgi:hypothetical protein
VLWIALALMTTPFIVFGYTDPGAGHYFWQSLLTGSFGLVFWMKALMRLLASPAKWWHRTKGTRKSSRRDSLVRN